MLVLSPDSTCDVCMENYTDGTVMPHAIRCGHIFCRPCLERTQPQCPLCRHNFDPSDIRKLHLSSASSETLQVDAETLCLWGDIINAGREDASLEEMQQVIDQCKVHLHTQPQERLCYPLVVSRHLLSNLLEERRTLQAQKGELTELDENRHRLMLDLVTALQKEEAVKDYCRRYEAESMARENRLLREELDRLRSSAVVDRNRTTTPDRSSFLFGTTIASMGIYVVYYAHSVISKLCGKR